MVPVLHWMLLNNWEKKNNHHKLFPKKYFIREDKKRCSDSPSRCGVLCHQAPPSQSHLDLGAAGQYLHQRSKGVWGLFEVSSGRCKRLQRKWVRSRARKSLTLELWRYKWWARIYKRCNTTRLSEGWTVLCQKLQGQTVKAKFR